MRTFAVWLFGLLAAGIFGGVIGVYLAPYYDGGALGFIGGLCAFTCARLWLGPTKAT
jgi:hypothetical protein